MALSGTNVIFPMAGSGTDHGNSLLWHDSHYETEFNSYFPCNRLYGPQPIVGRVGNFRQATFYALDAGRLTSGAGANVIPSGSTISDVQLQIQVASAVTPTPTASMRAVDAVLLARDGFWDATDGYAFTRCSGEVGNVVEGYNIAFAIRLRETPLGPNIVANTANGATGGYWATVRNSELGDERTCIDGLTTVFESTTSGSVDQVSMRLRRVNSPGGNYRFELWSVDGNDKPQTLLAYTGNAPCNNLLSSSTGSLVGRLFTDPGGSGSAYTLTSGVRYAIRFTVRDAVPGGLDGGGYVQHYVKHAPPDGTGWGSTGCSATVNVGWQNGYQHWFSLGSYGSRGNLPLLYGYDSNTIDVAPFGGYIASGLSGATYGVTEGTWVTLSGDTAPLVSALQAWVNDGSYTTSGDNALLAIHLMPPFVSGEGPTSDYTLTSGARMLVSWAPSNTAPTASIAATPTSGTLPFAVTFSASGSTDPEGDTLTYTWDFGDGSPAASGVLVSHTYTSGTGTVSAQLTATDPGGLSGTATQAIVLNNRPVASFTAVTGNRREPLSVALNASGSTDADGDTLTYTWDFGDGSATGSGVTTSHTYNQGSYTVTLSATDTFGAVGTASVAFVVLPNRDWFDGRGAQDWHTARGAQDWHTLQPARDWFVAEEED